MRWSRFGSPRKQAPHAGCPREAAGLEEPAHQQRAKTRGTIGWPAAASWGLSPHIQVCHPDLEEGHMARPTIRPAQGIFHTFIAELTAIIGKVKR